jgi:hypothetical protein
MPGGAVAADTAYPSRFTVLTEFPVSREMSTCDLVPQNFSRQIE